MTRGNISAAVGLIVILALVSSAQTNERREDGPPPTMVMAPQPQPSGGPGPIAPMQMRELAEQLRMRAREAQELSERLRRQADELDQMAKRLMDRGPGPQQQGRFQPMPSGPRMDERPELKRQIERLRDEARRAKEQGRREDSERIWQEADRLEQVLREQGLREGGGGAAVVLPVRQVSDGAHHCLHGLRKRPLSASDGGSGLPARRRPATGDVPKRPLE